MLKLSVVVVSLTFGLLISVNAEAASSMKMAIFAAADNGVQLIAEKKKLPKYRQDQNRKFREKMLKKDPNEYKKSEEYQSANPSDRKRADEASRSSRKLYDRAKSGKLTPFEKRGLGLVNPAK